MQDCYCGKIELIIETTAERDSLTERSIPHIVGIITRAAIVSVQRTTTLVMRGDLYCTEQRESYTHPV